MSSKRARNARAQTKSDSAEHGASSARIAVGSAPDPKPGNDGKCARDRQPFDSEEVRRALKTLEHRRSNSGQGEEVLDSLGLVSLYLEQQEGHVILDGVESPSIAPKPEQSEGQAPEFKTDEERISYFAGRIKWADAKAANPALTPVDHVKAVYPDRQLGLLRNDLLDERIDPKLYRAIYSWLQQVRADGSRNTLPADFCLPTLKQWNDQLLTRHGTPTGGDVSRAMRRGDPGFRELERLYAAARRRDLKKPAP